MKIRLYVLTVMLASAALLSACSTQAPTAAPSSSAGLGSPKNDNGVFMRRHESFLQRTKEGPVDLLFVGDSITEGWAHRAPALWQQRYGAYRPANFGIGGDRVEHVLWRLDHGELDGIRPKVIVLMIGTNNTPGNSAQIAQDIRQIVALIQHKQPQCKILLLGLLPRGPRKDASGRLDDALARMQSIRAINADIAGLDDGRRVRYLDIGDRFLQEGKIPDALMPDQLHPSLAGYQIWADAMQPLLDEMLGQP
ncbi:GDSL-type esterase/lipase family protein [Uliginosibacterium sediminicola]|uniref:GDSL-type esterase/lipase family protein n=1 Tax=Uliginosibacterium sediminicola TaxID=2024550 RepID=A0ABU9YZQ2_9RHOO